MSEEIQKPEDAFQPVKKGKEKRNKDYYQSDEYKRKRKLKGLNSKRGSGRSNKRNEFFI